MIFVQSMNRTVSTYRYSVNRKIDQCMYQNSDMKTFGNRMREARREKNLTQNQLAAAVGMSQGNLSDIERGNVPTSTYTTALANALGVEALWLAEGRGPKYRSYGAGVALPNRTIQTPTSGAEERGHEPSYYFSDISIAALHDYPVISLDEIMQGAAVDNQDTEFMQAHRRVACTSPAGHRDFAIIADDDSMNGGPRPIPRGSTVFISTETAATSGAIVLVRINGARPILRTFVQDGDLVQFQPTAQGLHARQISRQDAYEILGVAIESTLSHRI